MQNADNMHIPAALKAEDVTALLTHGEFYSLSVYDSLPSTNALLRERAETGEHEGAVVIANAQTAGRGRLGRCYYSPPGTGLYMSVLLRPALEAQSALLITPAAAVAGARAIARVCGIEVRIKWVNDLFAFGGKVAGILTEGALDASGALRYAVLGIGVNVAAPAGGYPDELRGVAASLNGAARAELAATMLDEFYAIYSTLPDRAFMQEYRERCLTIGKRVHVTDPQGGRWAQALAVDDDAALLVRYDGGETARITSGEASVRPEDVL